MKHLFHLEHINAVYVRISLPTDSTKEAETAFENLAWLCYQEDRIGESFYVASDKLDKVLNAIHSKASCRPFRIKTIPTYHASNEGLTGCYKVSQERVAA